jgi:hypothetical protein
MNDVAKCSLCGEPMPPGEQMFKFHGYSGPCPKPPLPQVAAIAKMRDAAPTLFAACWAAELHCKLLIEDGLLIRDEIDFAQKETIVVRRNLQEAIAEASGREPLIVTYTNLLHQHGSPDAAEVQAFVAEHRQDTVFLARVDVLNKTFLLKRSAK